MKGYADLLREAQARQNAERRAEQAERKLDAIRRLAGLADRFDNSTNRRVSAGDLLKILDGPQ